ncbi:MAG: PDZ domain-containing protein [Planctomycetaceae bacterium]|nr:PDZ domain-containing protein [Planctomycetaceae bacterium]
MYKPTLLLSRLLLLYQWRKHTLRQWYANEAERKGGWFRGQLRTPLLTFVCIAWFGLNSVESQEQDHSEPKLTPNSRELTEPGGQWQSHIDDLQASEFARRERASKGLGAADFSAMVHVLPLMTSTDAEVAWRAKEVLTQQGIRGSADVVRRIALVLKLLTAAGHREFAEESERFESRVASLRLAEASRRLESVPGITVIPGPQLGQMMVAGNAMRIQGGVMIIGGGQIQVGPQVRILGNGDLLEIPAMEAAKQNLDADAAQQSQQNSETDANVAATEQSHEVGADEDIRRSYLKDNLKDWLEKCITAPTTELLTLENSWQEIGLIRRDDAERSQPMQSFDLTINGDLSKEHVELLSDFFQSPILVTLAMSGVEMSPELQTLIVETAEAGKIQYLNTVQCGYDLKTSIALMKVLKAGGLGYWQTQGRAMLGIKADGVLIGQELSERGSARVGEVTKGSAADQAGIQSGDLVRRINDVPIENFDELRRVVSAFGVGDRLQVEVERGPKTLTLEVKLQEYRSQ